MPRRWNGTAPGWSNCNPRMPDVSPELADKVLSADLRNLIQKVSGGANLSPAERELMHRYLADETPPEALLSTRKIALTRKWTLGGKLTKEERKEAGIPDLAPLLHRQTTERYQRPFQHYAKIYQRDVRNIKRLVAKGRTAEPPDFPPLDAPADMAAWFRRVMGQEPRENLTRFERENEAGSDAAESAAEDAATSDEPPPLPAMKLDGSTVHAADMGLRRVQMLVDATFSQMQIALKHQRMKEYKTLFIEYTKLEQMLRSWEKDIIKIQEGRGEVLRTREINTEIVSFLTVIGQGFFNGLLKVIRQLAPQMPTHQQRELALSITDGCFAHGKKTRWSDAWKPEIIDVEAA